MAGVFPSLRYWSSLAFTRLSSAVSSGSLVLAYHRIADISPDPLKLAVTPANFRSQLASLSSSFNFLTPEQFFYFWQQRHFPPRSMMLTFDDGYRDNLQTAVPLLRRNNLSAIFFITNLGFKRLNPWWDYLTSDDQFNRFRSSPKIYHRYLAGIGQNLMNLAELKKFSRSKNVILGGHTVMHRQLAILSPAEQEREIRENFEFLRRQLKITPRAFAYPFGNVSFYSSESVRLVKKYYSLAFTTMPGLVSRWHSSWELPRLLVPDIPGGQLVSLIRSRFPHFL